MKIVVFVMASLFCLLSCSNSPSSWNVGNNGGVSRATTDPGRIPLPDSTQLSADIKKSALVGSLRVDSYEGDELFRSFFFQDGLYVKGITYNTQTRKKDREITFFYKKSGEFDHAKIDGDVASKENSFEIKRAFEELNFQSAILKSRGIVFPLANIVADEVSDLSEVLSIANNYSDFKTENLVEGTQKVIKFIGFNKTSRFHNSPMALLIGNGDFITVRDYSLTLQSGFPLMELYRTSVGELIKTYSYKDGQLTGVVYKFTDLQNQSKYLEKRFEYHELNQKP